MDNVRNEPPTIMLVFQEVADGKASVIGLAGSLKSADTLIVDIKRELDIKGKSGSQVNIIPMAVEGLCFDRGFTHNWNYKLGDELHELYYGSEAIRKFIKGEVVPMNPSRLFGSGTQEVLHGQ